MSNAEDHSTGRRDFIYYATAGAATVVGAAAVWPLVNQMNPSADVQALSSIRVDVGGIAPGTQLTVLFQGKPVFIRRRTAEEILEADAVDPSSLPDPVARNPNIDSAALAVDANRALTAFGAEATGGAAGDSPADALDGEWLVQIGVCTHLGCVPLGEAGDFGGWFCPCHGSHYDTAGRIRKGPAPQNLHIPLAQFLDATTIQLG